MNEQPSKSWFIKELDKAEKAIAQLEAENEALILKARHLIQSINIIRGTMVKDRTHKDVFGGDVYLVDHMHMWVLVRNAEEVDTLLKETD